MNAINELAPITALWFMLLGCAIMLVTMYDTVVNDAYRPCWHAIGVIAGVCTVLWGATFL
jgi:K+ transporter